MNRDRLHGLGLARRLLVGAAFAASLAVAGCGKSEETVRRDPNTINFSILATENATSLETTWKPVLADMEKTTGLKVKPVYGTNYTALVESLRFRQSDAGWFSNFSGLEAVRRGKGEVFARTVDASGDDGYTAVLIVPAKSKTTLADVLKCDKRLNFGIGDAKSTSGTLAPMTYLFAPKGIRPEDCFKTVRSANHQANLFAVAKGVLDVATNNSTSLRLNQDREGHATKEVRVIWTSPRLPEDPIIWRKDLDPAVKEKLRQFFLTYGQGEGAEPERQRKLLAALSIGGFKPADDDHLIAVREMEATEALEEAKADGDAARIAKARKALDAIEVERSTLEARTGQPAAAQ